MPVLNDGQPIIVPSASSMSTCSNQSSNIYTRQSNITFFSTPAAPVGDPQSHFKNCIKQCLELLEEKNHHNFYSHLLREMGRVHRKNKENLKLCAEETLAVMARSLYEKAIALDPGNKRAREELNYFLNNNFPVHDAKDKSNARIKEYEKGVKKDPKKFFFDALTKYVSHISKLYPDREDNIYLHILNQVCKNEFITAIKCGNEQANIKAIFDTAKRNGHKVGISY